MIPSTASSALAARIWPSSSSRSTSRSSNVKPLDDGQGTFCPSYLMGQNAHFSLQVLEVQSAYMRAAGSEFARKPTSEGIRWSLERPSETSDRRDFATVPARTTLHEAGSASKVAMTREIYFTRLFTIFVKAETVGGKNRRSLIESLILF